MKPIPGVDIFSKEWFDAHASNVQEPLLGVVRGICTGYQLGNTVDPNILAEIIEDGLRPYVGSRVKIKNKEYMIRGVAFDGVSWFFVSTGKAMIKPEKVEAFLSGPR